MNHNTKQDSIFIENMRFFGHHGVLDFEANIGQPFVISVKLRTSTRKAGLSDDLNDSTHYGEVFNIIKNITEHMRFNLLECLAETIATQVLKEFPLITGIYIKINKPHAPISGVFDSVGVEIDRERE